MNQIDTIRAEFPALQQLVHGKPLVYLDNAASSQKPTRVIEAVAHFYRRDNANVHRGLHALSERATAAYEAAREKVQRFINARHAYEIIFTRGTTDAINLVATSFGQSQLTRGDRILLTFMEHHSNIVPWQLAAERAGASLAALPVNMRGELELEHLMALLQAPTKLLALTHVSNALGTINPVQQIIQQAHAMGVPVLVDGAQAVAHAPVDVQALDADFYVFSGHKMFGPTGIGVLYGKEVWLNKLPPYQGGGDMIKTVSFSGTTYADLPNKFEAGTPPIAAAIGLGKAIDFIRDIGFDLITSRERDLLNYGTQVLQSIPGLTLIGTAINKAAILSFTLDGTHPHDIGTLLDREGIAIRAGHHCAQPLMERFGVSATARASLMFYNKHEELDRLAAALHKAIRLLAA